MPDTIGEFVTDGIGSRDTDTDTGDSTASGNTGGDREPEILHGYDVEGPSTEKFTGTGDGIRLTKSGKPDRRSKHLRRNGTGNSADAKAESVPLKLNLEDLLLSVHMMGAELLKVPELELDRGEAKKLADAIAEVNKYYGVQVDPKKMAIINLGVVGVTIYGSRILALRMRKKIERDQHRGATPINEPRKETPGKPSPTPQRQPVGDMSPSQIFGDQSAAI
jgi:hypothetical protein